MKLIKLFGVLLVSLALIVGCSQKKTEEPVVEETATKKIEELRVVFVPSRDAKDIAEQTEPLKQLLIDQLAKSGYEVGSVSISTMTNYEAAGEALASGSAEVGLLPGGTYAAYSDKGVKVILASIRNGLKYDTTDPKDWNTGEANENNTDIVTYYRGIIIAGPSAKGKELSDKVNNGEALTWEDLSTAKWCLANYTSGSGYQYPAVWLQDQFGKTYVDMPADSLVESGGYSGAVNKLALGQCDVAPGYNDFRMDNADKWVSEWGMENIWTETQVIGVTDKIQNDTVSVSEALVDEDLANALADAFIGLAETEEGKKAIEIYNHKGYQKVTDADYEAAKKVNALVQTLQK